MHCNSCDQDVRAIVALDPERGKLWQCPRPDCGAVIGPYEESGIVTGPDGDKVDLATVQPMAAGTFPALPEMPDVTVGGEAIGYRAVPPPPVIEPRGGGTSTADDIEQMAIDRLAYLEDEIERLQALVAERAKLQAMLGALTPASGKREIA
jgi:hypothetical protein